MKNEQRREESIEMHIECISPFHVLAGGDVFPLKVPVGGHPKHRGHDAANKDAIDEYNPQQKLDIANKVKMQDNRQTRGGD